jgi:hypothetical protein
MGASNYRPCPKCIAARKAKYEDAVKRHKALYGKVSLEDYNAQFKIVADLKKAISEVDNDLAEYVDIRVCEDGCFIVSYSAGCRAGGCDFEFQYNYEQKVPLT